MIARRILAAAGLALFTAPAVAQQQAPAPTPPQRARPRRQPAPLPLPPPEPPAPVSRSEPAPVPNNDIEAPRAESRVPGPQFNPTLIDPNDPQAATANDANSLRAREDRLLRNPAPGARLRLPFSY